MYYREYDRARASWLRSLASCKELIEEKEKLFQKTQPRSVDYQADRVKSSGVSNALEEYVAAVDWIDQRLEEAERIAERKRKIMEDIETELRKSKDIYDRVYVLRYLEHWRINRICKEVAYSKSQIYRILRTMRVNATLEDAIM